MSEYHALGPLGKAGKLEHLCPRVVQGKFMHQHSGVRCNYKGLKKGALIITYTILGIPYDNYSILGSKTLFELLEPSLYY